MTPFGSPRRHLAVCDSTNDVARAWAADPDGPAPNGALVTADFQTHGRGRRGHRWQAAPAESALMSFVLRPRLAAVDAWQFGFAASLGVADALRGMGLDARLKWPNDVLVGGGKIAGVLVETALAPPAAAVENPDFAWAIAGIGLNVNQADFVPGDYAYPPTSLRLCTGQECPLERAILTVAAEFGRRWEEFERDGFGPILAAWRERLAVGAAVVRGSERAILVDLTPLGHARVRLSDGTFTEWATVEG